MELHSSQKMLPVKRSGFGSTGFKPDLRNKETPREANDEAGVRGARDVIGRNTPGAGAEIGLGGGAREGSSRTGGVALLR